MSLTAGLTSDANSFEEYLLPVAASISASLVSADTFSSMLRIARLVPEACASNTFGFECPLGNDDPHADFLVQTTAAHGRGSLAEFNDVGSAPAWDRVRDFALGWSGGSPLVYQSVDNVWLEFDLDGPRSDVPSAFFGFRPVRAAQDLLDATRTRRLLAATLEAVGLLRGGDSASLSSKTLSRCFDALPGSAQVFQVGVMLSRAEEVVRLCLRLRSFEDAVRYLQLVGWPGDEYLLRRTLEPLGSLADHLCLDVDVGETVLPKVGLECYVSGGGKWVPILDRLLSDGLCTPTKRDSLLAYPGHVTENETRTPWPRSLTQASNLLGPRALSFFVRWLHHIKVVHRPDHAAEAKAYLGVDYRWRSSQRRDRS